jgi:hypothetical protein
MRKQLAVLFLGLALCVPMGASAAKKPSYTLPTKGCTVLQNEADRALAPADVPDQHEPIAGESPVTGLPWQGEYRPMLVQICNSYGKVKIQGKTVKTSGVGELSPWGVQYADIIYESLMSPNSTRFTMLFSDCFAEGQPAGGVGPVRSIRSSALYLRAEWQASLVYSGGFGGMFGWRDHQTPTLLEETGANRQGALFNMLTEPYSTFKNRVVGVKSPSNLNVDLQGLHELIPTDFVSQAHSFLFTDESPYTQGYALATTVHLDWGASATISHFQYDSAQNTYLRYCGPGIKATKWLTFSSFPTADDHNVEHLVPLTFANVIVQRVPYVFETGTSAMSIPQFVGQGNADIFIGGHYIPGYWVHQSILEPTVYFDDHGEELVFNRGKTYIAQFPTEAVCAVQGDE